jgi:hypothetical protein
MPETNRSGTTIEKLLEERSQYEQWLARLNDAGAPDAVRSRVRSDYQARLQGVMEQLRAHGTTIAAELERHETEQGQLEQREAEVQETLAEAQVRHAVGEYADAQWDEISKAQEGALGQVRSQLDRVRGEIDRLSEVHRLITAPVPAPEPPPPPRAAEPQRPAPEPAVTSYAPPPAAATPRFVPKPPAAKLPGDELDFIKSVNVEQAASLSPSAAERQRNSGAQPIVTTTTPMPETAVPSPAPAAPAAKAAPQPPTANKTLKCGDCGTLNRATEWYCERCGAELAAL